MSAIATRCAGKTKRGSALPAPNGARLFEGRDQVRRGRPRLQRAVDQQGRHQRRAVEIVLEARGDEGLQRAELLLLGFEAGRHRMAAALQHQSRLARGDDGLPEMQAPRPSGRSALPTPFSSAMTQTGR